MAETELRERHYYFIAGEFEKGGGTGTFSSLSDCPPTYNPHAFYEYFVLKFCQDADIPREKLKIKTFQRIPYP